MIEDPRKIIYVKEHKWFCINCTKVWFLRVDERIEIDVQRYNVLEAHISIHCSDYNHEVIHKEKEEFKIKYA